MCKTFQGSKANLYYWAYFGVSLNIGNIDENLISKVMH